MEKYASIKYFVFIKDEDIVTFGYCHQNSLYNNQIQKYGYSCGEFIIVETWTL